MENENGNGNGNGSSWRSYALTHLAGLVMLFGGLWVQSISSRLEQHDTMLRDLNRAKDEETIILQNQLDIKRRIEQLEQSRRTGTHGEP